jgi:transcriptional regulator with PAS, ATPase and Fis domain
LDEVGDLPLEMQPKLLRAIEDYEFERVGGTKVIRTNLRVIAATNQDLEQMLVDGRFRKDLFYRLNVIPLHIPPLRERKTDIIHIAQWMLEQMAVEANIPEVKLDAAAQNALKRHQWPGNVRELSNVLERTLSALEGSTIRLQDLPFYLYRNSKGSSEQNPSSLKDLQARTEKETIHDALKASNNNKAKAARMLGIHRTLLYKKMKKYHIPLDSSASKNGHLKNGSVF